VTHTRRFFLAACVALAAYAGVGLHAITYGAIDATNAFGNTGAFVVISPTGRLSPICSGTLIAPDVFLTASHCTTYFEHQLEPAGYTAAVSFDNPIPFGNLTNLATTTLVTVTQVASNPLYNQAQSDSQDIAVLLVDPQQTAGITPAVLPVAGLLDELSAQNGLKSSVFTAVGYGVQNRVVGGGTPSFEDQNPIPRMYAYSTFNALNGGYIRLSQNPAKGDGGTCYGDSGGPNFLTVGGTPTLVAVTITGDAVCRATNVDYRTDTPSARAFLGQYVTLP
jgi:hypothetical protein